MDKYSLWPIDVDQAFANYDAEDGSTWFISGTEFRYEINKVLQDLCDEKYS